MNTILEAILDILLFVQANEIGIIYSAGILFVLYCFVFGDWEQAGRRWQAIADDFAASLDYIFGLEAERENQEASSSEEPPVSPTR